MYVNSNNHHKRQSWFPIQATRWQMWSAWLPLWQEDCWFDPQFFFMAFACWTNRCGLMLTMLEMTVIVNGCSVVTCYSGSTNSPRSTWTADWWDWNQPPPHDPLKDSAVENGWMDFQFYVHPINTACIIVSDQTPGRWTATEEWRDLFFETFLCLWSLIDNHIITPRICFTQPLLVRLLLPISP